ncbi:radical SAM/SPASM domain-containing protein [Anaerospora hongkongensis]|uniref:radical SAM/SPASM domain-containing protein n=1 Tax=Anaerospora hongkongensis TaxID=244830 RepID=UPI0028A02CD7|nr:radical SAM protein [Anaerospora hongkongensis]
MSVKDRVNAISRNDNLLSGTPYTTAKIELTGICTLNCAFCYNKQMAEYGERQKFMNDNDFAIVLYALKMIGTIKEVGLFYMGESGTHPQLAKYYKELKESGFFTYLTTNGTTQSNILNAIPYIDSLKVSWNYKDQNDFVSKTAASEWIYGIIIKNIKVLNEECQRLGKTLTVSTILDSDKDDYKEALSQLEFGDHYWLPLQSQGGTYATGVAGVIGEYENKVSPVPCWSLFKGFYVDVDLNVRTCCYGHSKEHIIGNLKDKPVLELLRFGKGMKMRSEQSRDIIPDVCKNCLDHC